MTSWRMIRCSTSHAAGEPVENWPKPSRDTLQCWHTRRGWAAGRYQFPNRDRHKRHHSQVRKSPWTMFFYGAYTTKKLTAAPLQRPRYVKPFLRPQAGPRSTSVFLKKYRQKIKL